jgi:integrase
MASIRKRGNSYQVIYRNSQGQQTSESFARKRDADRRKAEIEVELQSGTFISPREARRPFGEWFERWFDARQVSAHRQSVERGLYRKHVEPRWATTRMDAISHMEVQAWVTDLAKTLAPATVREILALLRMPLDAAIRDNRIRTNPAKDIKVPPVRPSRQTSETVLTGQELGLVAEAMPERWSTMVLVLGWLGPRWSEVVGLRLCDFNPLKGELRIGEITVVEVAGHPTPKAGGKTSSAQRTIPVPSTLVKLMSEYVAQYRASAGPNDFLFVTKTGGPHPQRRNFTRDFHKALSECGLEGRGLTVRQLRHTAASLMLDAGLPIQDVSQRLGHAKTSTTMDIYAHLLTSTRNVGTDSLDLAIRSSTA